MDHQVIIRNIGDYDPVKIGALVGESLITLGMEELITGKKVLLKPNFLFAVEPDTGIITHPMFIEGVILALSAYTDQLFLTDSPGWGSLGSVIEMSGMAPILNKYRVKVIPEEVYEDCLIGGKLLTHARLIKGIGEFDLIVNLPKMKTHGMTTITGAVKNLFGLVHGRTKAKMHFRYERKNSFYRMLFDLHEYLSPGLNIMDGIVSLQGCGPGTSGKPKQTSKILISRDAVKLDLYFAVMAGATDAVEKILAAYPGYAPVAEDETIPRFEDFELPDKDYGILSVFPLPEKVSEWIRNKGMAYPEIVSDSCVSCYRCVDNCPTEPASINRPPSGKPEIQRKTCIRCYCCQEICPQNSVRVRRSLFQWLINLIFGRA